MGYKLIILKVIDEGKSRISFTLAAPIFIQNNGIVE
jgi:hypothetical protein